MKKLLFLLVFALLCGTVAAQDLIVKRNAEEVQGKILRIGASKIEYTLAGNSAGAVYTLPTSDVLYVKYADGRKKVFDNTPTMSKRELAIRKDRYPHYEGDVAVAYALSVNTIPLDRVVFETVHGVRLSPYAFIGAGAGFNYFYNNGFGSKGSGLIAPFANAKGYLPVSQDISIYMSLDLGASIGVWNATGGNIYTAVGPGVSFGSTKNRMRCDLSIRYQHMGKNLDAVMFRLGFGF